MQLAPLKRGAVERSFAQSDQVPYCRMIGKTMRRYPFAVLIATELVGTALAGPLEPGYTGDERP